MTARQRPRWWRGFGGALLLYVAHVLAASAAGVTTQHGALPGSVLAAGLREGQLQTIGTSQTQLATLTTTQPLQAAAVDTSAGGDFLPTVKAAGYTTVTATGSVSAPGNQLFALNRSPGGYLVETDAAFTGYRTWVSSSYMLSQLQIDPERTMKRYGDGFAEQRLIQSTAFELHADRLGTCGRQGRWRGRRQRQRNELRCRLAHRA